MQTSFPLHHSLYVCKIPICVTFTCNCLDRTGLDLVVFGLGLVSISVSHYLVSALALVGSLYVLVLLTSLPFMRLTCCNLFGYRPTRYYDATCAQTATLRCIDVYTVCLKKTSPTFLAVTRESIVNFHNFWHTCYRESRQSVDAIVSHHT